MKISLNKFFKKKSIVIHPFLFAVYPILFLFSHNIKEVQLKVILIPILIIVGISFVLWFLLSPLIKNKNKRGVVLSLFFIMFFSYGHLSNLLFDKEINIIFLTLFFLFLILLIFFSLKIRKDFIRANLFFNIVSLFLVLYSIINITYYELKYRIGHSLNSEIFSIKIPDEKNSSINKKDYPDIYYIIFDRYGSSEMLKEFFNYDNSQFDNYLREKGFFVASQSKANYPSTYLSLASSLNFQYLDFLFEITGETNDRTIAYELIKKSKIVNFLKSKGYKYFHFGCWWGPTRKNKYADKNFVFRDFKIFNILLDEYTETLFKTTLAYPIIAKFFKKELFESKGGPQKVIQQLNQLELIPHIKGPKFIFAHFLITHPPYYFDKNGKIVSPEVAKQKKEKDLYLDCIAFTNKKIKNLVDKIISNSSSPPVIILQSDEGPFGSVLKGKNKWRRTYRLIKYKASILNAYYLSGINHKNLYQKISPVNTFRLILNHYFGFNFKLLKDRVFVSKKRENLYKFRDVTNRVTFGTIFVKSTPKNAKIYFNGEYIDKKTDAIIPNVEPGSHTIKLTREGYRDYETTFQVWAVHATPLKIKLEKKDKKK